MTDAGVVVDESAGTLRASLEALAALPGAPSADPLLEPIARAIDEALLRIEVELRGERGHVSGGGWISRDLAVLCVPLPGNADADGPVFAFPVPDLPHRFAELVDLGPRDAGIEAGIAVVERVALEELTLRPDVPEPADVRERLGMVEEPPAGWMTSLAAPAGLHWRLVLTTDGLDAAPFARMREVLDTYEHLWSVTDIPDDPSLVAIAPVTPAMVWLALTTILPDAEEIAELYPDLARDAR